MEIKNFTRVYGDAYTLAEFSVYMPEWKVTLNNFKIKVGKKGSWFVAYPQSSKKNESGGWDSKKTIIPDADLQKHFEDAVYHHVRQIMKLEGMEK